MKQSLRWGVFTGSPKGFGPVEPERVRREEQCTVPGFWSFRPGASAHGHYVVSSTSLGVGSATGEDLKPLVGDLGDDSRLFNMRLQPVGFAQRCFLSWRQRSGHDSASGSQTRVRRARLTLFLIS